MEYDRGINGAENKPVSILNKKPLETGSGYNNVTGNDNGDKKLELSLEKKKLGEDKSKTNMRSGVGSFPFSSSGSPVNDGVNRSVDSSLRWHPIDGTSAVSFTLSDDQKVSQHRYSINSKPSKPLEPNVNGLDTIPAVTGSHESSAIGKNSIVHMPGDFIYFDSNENKSSARLQQQRKKEWIELNSGPQVPFTEFFQKQDDKKFHILLGATGSVATIKVPEIIDKLFKIYTRDRVSIQLVVTKPAEHFLRGLKVSTDVKIWREEDEWSGFRKMGDPVLHHELKRWADIFLIAPLSANTLAKLAYGICDNLLTCVLRDWTSVTPVMVAPAMNTFMYINPMTKRHLNILKEDAPYVEVLKPVEKVLICGDIGMGGMREWNDIVEILRRKISEICKARDDKDVAMQAGEEDGDDDEDVKEEEDDDDEEDDEEGEKDGDDEDDDEDEEDDDDEDGDDEDDENDYDTSRCIR